MDINDAEYLSQLSTAELKAVCQQWPNPIHIIAFIPAVICGAGVFILYALSNNSEVELIAVLAAVFIVMLAFLGYVFSKLDKAKKLLKAYAELRLLPSRCVIREFQQYYPRMASAWKKAG